MHGISSVKNGIWRDLCSVDPERRRGGCRLHVVLYKWASQLTSIMWGFEVLFLLRILRHVLSLLLPILTSQISMECFVFRFLPTHFFSQSLEFVIQTYFYFLVLLLKSDLCHTAAVIWKELKSYNFVFFFRWSMKTWPVCCPSSSLFPLSQFSSCSPILLPHKSKFYLLLVAVCSLSLM